MQVFFRYIICSAMAIGLATATGCTSSPLEQIKATPNMFSWMKKEEPEVAKRTTMNQVLSQPRPELVR